MADRVFCIDFGSAYTKVALRRDPSANSELLTWPNIDFCVPTTVAVDRRQGTKPRLAFGDEAADQQGGGGIDVYRNWKRTIFLTPGSAGTKQSPLEALLESDELIQLANKFGVANGQIAYLQQLVTTARSLIAGPGGRMISAESQQQTITAAIAAHFFYWLRQRVLEACAKLPTAGLKYEEIPVRVAIPAFAHSADRSHPGAKLLLEALNKAGWPLHTEQPTVAEPDANTIGILTKASNVLSKSGRINIGDMFSKGPLITVLKGDPHHPTYRALVIDVGAFTTDFAALTVKPDSKSEPETGIGFNIIQHSVPFGVSNLDDVMRSVLKVDEWPVKPTWSDWAKVQQSVYTNGKGYRAPGLGRVVGGPTDSEAVQTALTDFGTRLAEEATKFCEPLTPVSMQELILTGGGSSIPVVRDVLQKAATACGQNYVKTHAPDLKRGKAGSPLVDKLDDHFTRGGSALGGASIYFEKNYY
jgi:hypothetical protein